LKANQKFVCSKLEDIFIRLQLVQFSSKLGEILMYNITLLNYYFST